MQHIALETFISHLSIKQKKNGVIPNRTLELKTILALLPQYAFLNQIRPSDAAIFLNAENVGACTYLLFRYISFKHFCTHYITL